MVAEKRPRAAANQREERANSGECDTVAVSVTCWVILGSRRWMVAGAGELPGDEGSYQK